MNRYRYEHRHGSYTQNHYGPRLAVRSVLLRLDLGDGTPLEDARSIHVRFHYCLVVEKHTVQVGSTSRSDGEDSNGCDSQSDYASWIIVDVSSSRPALRKCKPREHEDFNPLIIVPLHVCAVVTQYTGMH